MLKDNWNSNEIFCLIFSYSVIILIYFLGIAYDISRGYKKLPIFGGTPVFGSIFKQNSTIQYFILLNYYLFILISLVNSKSFFIICYCIDINFKLSSAAQPPLTECVFLSTQCTDSNLRNTFQNKNTVLSTPTYIGFGQYRNPSQFKPQTELER